MSYQCFTIIQSILCLYQFPLTKKLSSMPTVFQNRYLKRNLYLHFEKGSHVLIIWKYHPRKSWYSKIFSFKWCLCVYLHYAEDLCSFWEHRVIKLSFFQDHAFNIGLFKSNREEEKFVSFSYIVHNFLSWVDRWEYLYEGLVLCDRWRVHGSFPLNQTLRSKP